MVADGGRGRIFLSPTALQESLCGQADEAASRIYRLPKMPEHLRRSFMGRTLMESSLRQDSLRLSTRSQNLFGKHGKNVAADAVTAGIPVDSVPLDRGGRGAFAYSQADLGISRLRLERLADICNALSHGSRQKHRLNDICPGRLFP